MRPAILFALCVLGASACSHPLGSQYNGDDPTDGGQLDLRVASVDGSNQCSADVAQNECHDATDCNDGNPNTVDTCQLVVGGEFPFGTCLHSGCDGGVACANQAVDPSCGDTDAGQVYPPFVPLSAPDVPAACANGFQLTDAKSTFVYTIKSKTTAGSRALTLDLDIATYTQADGVQITGVDGNCKKYTLFDTCHLKTADDAETTYTNGKARPADAAIRQYHLDLRPGTTQLSVDFGRVVSPMYVQILGLCDFTLPTPAGSTEKWFAPVP